MIIIRLARREGETWETFIARHAGDRAEEAINEFTCAVDEGDDEASSAFMALTCVGAIQIEEGNSNGVQESRHLFQMRLRKAGKHSHRQSLGKCNRRKGESVAVGTTRLAVKPVIKGSA